LKNFAWRRIVNETAGGTLGVVIFGDLFKSFVYKAIAVEGMGE
jgi:hypothetical protein